MPEIQGITLAAAARQFNYSRRRMEGFKAHPGFPRPIGRERNAWVYDFVEMEKFLLSKKPQRAAFAELVGVRLTKAQYEYCLSKGSTASDGLRAIINDHRNGRIN